MTRLFAVLYLTAVACTGCSDPQHGAWKVKSGIWLLLMAGGVLLLCAAADFTVRQRTQGPHS